MQDSLVGVLSAYMHAQQDRLKPSLLVGCFLFVVRIKSENISPGAGCVLRKRKESAAIRYTKHKCTPAWSVSSKCWGGNEIRKRPATRISLEDCL